jgi:hypothetical protein
MFALVAGWDLARGAASCKCLGRVLMVPWLTLSMDLVVLFLLLCFRPVVNADRSSLPTGWMGAQVRNALMVVGGFLILFVGIDGAGLRSAVFGSPLCAKETALHRISDHPESVRGAQITVRATDSGGLFVADTFTVTVRSASDQLTTISDLIQDLVDAGQLSANNANPLTGKLSSAMDKLNDGHVNASINKLNAFINQVNAFVNSGKLTPAQGAQLIAAAQAAINSISQGGGSTLLSSSGPNGSSDDVPIEHEHELLVGSIGVLLTHATGTITDDQQARLEETLVELNARLGSYGLQLVVLDGQTTADAQIHVELGPTSACGTAADAILGCTSGPGEITILDGWSWYAAADETAIGWGQYDLQTVLTHEIGHAVGMGHSGDEWSVMYGWLADGTTRRGLTDNDLSLLGTGGGGGPLRAAPRTAERATIISIPTWRPQPTGHTRMDHQNDDTLVGRLHADTVPVSRVSVAHWPVVGGRILGETIRSGFLDVFTRRMNTQCGSDEGPSEWSWANLVDGLMCDLGSPPTQTS